MHNKDMEGPSYNWDDPVLSYTRTLVTDRKTARARGTDSQSNWKYLKNENEEISATRGGFQIRLKTSIDGKCFGKRLTLSRAHSREPSGAHSCNNIIAAASRPTRHSPRTCACCYFTLSRPPCQYGGYCFYFRGANWRVAKLRRVSECPETERRNRSTGKTIVHIFPK